MTTHPAPPAAAEGPRDADDRDDGLPALLPPGTCEIGQEPLLPALGTGSPRVRWPADACGPDGHPTATGRARALADAARVLPLPVDDFDHNGVLVGVDLPAPHGARAALVPAAHAALLRQLGARELLLAWSADGAARVEDAWAATTELGALSAWATARGGDASLLVIHGQGIAGVVRGGARRSASGADEPVPTPRTAGPHPAAWVARVVFAVLLGVMLALALKLIASTGAALSAP